MWSRNRNFWYSRINAALDCHGDLFWFCDWCCSFATTCLSFEIWLSNELSGLNSGEFSVLCFLQCAIALSEYRKMWWRFPCGPWSSRLPFWPWFKDWLWGSHPKRRSDLKLLHEIAFGAVSLVFRALFPEINSSQKIAIRQFGQQMRSRRTVRVFVFELSFRWHTVLFLMLFCSI